MRPGSDTGGQFHGTIKGKPMYKIVRNYRDSYEKRTIKRGLTLDEAQAHCRDPETSSSSCTNSTGLRRTKRKGPWFDGYTET